MHEVAKHLICMNSLIKCTTKHVDIVHFFLDGQPMPSALIAQFCRDKLLDVSLGVFDAQYILQQLYLSVCLLGDLLDRG